MDHIVILDGVIDPRCSIFSYFIANCRLKTANFITAHHCYCYRCSQASFGQHSFPDISNRGAAVA